MVETVIGGAARRRCQAILGDMLWPAQAQSISGLQTHSDLQVVDISCGAGTSSLGMIEMAGPGSTIWSFDTDEVNIASARKKANEINSVCDYTFIHDHFENWNEAVQVDYVLGACIMNNVARNRAIVLKAADCMKPGGVLMLDFINFSDVQVYPASYVFDCFNAYIETYQNILGQQLNTQGIHALGEDTPFTGVEVHRMSPMFLEPGQRCLPSLMLEYLAAFIVENGLSTRVELDAIISELRHLEQRPDVMITAPVHLRLTAHINPGNQ